ncbi:hypothetical protein CENSYa_0655 [Cenarchaeum symbiosum A]|uniref:Uncharacterized protein n=1 Tax=Cenarchaeum symbiosum (strain A) TaxID=414004 RepID=A0RVC1_CENSY|nr:hypothetical protein CENSYa_0655 [Cenarchaeum symbiosum A]
MFWIYGSRLHGNNCTGQILLGFLFKGMWEYPKGEVRTRQSSSVPYMQTKTLRNLLWGRINRAVITASC